MDTLQERGNGREDGVREREPVLDQRTEKGWVRRRYNGGSLVGAARLRYEVLEVTEGSDVISVGPGY